LVLIVEAASRMTRWIAGVATAAAIGAGTALAQQPSELVTIWSCKDKDGRTHVTNLKEDTAGKDCRIVQQQRVTVVPSAKPSAKTPSPPGFPKETVSDRLATKEKQRQTLERELAQEQDLLAEAKRKLGEQESIRGGDERNYAKVLERLQPYRDTVEVHTKNVEALRRELSNLYR